MVHFQSVLLKVNNPHKWDLSYPKKSNYWHWHSKYPFGDKFPILHFSSCSDTLPIHLSKSILDCKIDLSHLSVLTFILLNVLSCYQYNLSATVIIASIPAAPISISNIFSIVIGMLGCLLYGRLIRMCNVFMGYNWCWSIKCFCFIF